MLSKSPTQNILSRLQGQQAASLLALSQPVVLVQISSEIQHSTFPPQKERARYYVNACAAQDK